MSKPKPRYVRRVGNVLFPFARPAPTPSERAFGAVEPPIPVGWPTRTILIVRGDEVTESIVPKIVRREPPPSPDPYPYGQSILARVLAWERKKERPL